MAGQAKETAGIKWEDEKYVDNLKKRVLELEGVIDHDVEATAIEFVNRSKEFAPVDTGFMRSNIYLVPGEDEKGVYYGIYCRAKYWIYVEFGTRYMRAQPFFRPALVLAREYLIRRVKGR